MKFQLTTFDGMVPRVDSRLLEQQQAQTAENCDLMSGVIKPIKKPLQIAVLPDATRLSIYPYPSVSNWLSWTTDVDVVKGPVSDDQYQRIYYTGSGKPKVRGIDSSVQEEYDLGIPAPATKCTVATSNKTAMTWTRTWHYHYETPSNGIITQEGTMTEGVLPADIQETTPGVLYTAVTLPAKTTAGVDDFFVPWFDAYDSDSVLLGRVYAEHSLYHNNNDCFINGAKVKMSGAIVGLGGTATLSYDTTRTSDYTIDRAYLTTFISKWGEEGKPSPASAIVGIDPAHNGHISGFDVTTTGNHVPIEYVRLYRTVTTDGGTFYQRVADIKYKATPTLIAVTNMGAGLVGIPAVAHGYNVGDGIVIAGTTNYNGGYAVKTGTTADVIAITDTYVAETLTAACTIYANGYIDSLEDGETGEILPSEDWEIPPAAMAGLVVCPGGFLCGFSGKDLYLSEPNRPHAWPDAYVNTLDANIVGLAVSENTIAIMTEAQPYIGTGSTPDQVTPSQLPILQACVSKRGIATVMGMIIYPSPDGLVGISGGTANLMTVSTYTKEQWKTLLPTTAIGAQYDGNYFMRTTNYLLIVDFDDSRSALTSTTETMTGLHSDILTDTLYLIQGANITAWRLGATNLTATWKSKRLHFPRQGYWGIGRLVADSYPQTMIIYGAGLLSAVIPVPGAYAFRMPQMRPETDWEVEIITTDNVSELTLATSMGDL